VDKVGRLTATTFFLEGHWQKRRKDARGFVAAWVSRINGILMLNFFFVTGMFQPMIWI